MWPKSRASWRRTSCTISGQRQRLEAAKHALAILLGKAKSNWIAPDFTARSFTMPQTLPVSLPSELLRNRPDILEAEAKLHAAVAEVGVATANLYPNINLTATLEQTALTPQNVFSYSSTAWTLAAGLSAPVFHSGELKAKQRQAQANARVALAEYELTVLQAFGQVADVLSSIAHDNQAYEAQKRALDAGTGARDDDAQGLRHRRHERTRAGGRRAELGAHAAARHPAELQPRRRRRAVAAGDRRRPARRRGGRQDARASRFRSSQRPMASSDELRNR